MIMNLVGQETVRSAQPLIAIKGEDIVYSMLERHSRKASEPTTTRRTSIITLIVKLKPQILF